MRLDGGEDFTQPKAAGNEPADDAVATIRQLVRPALNQPLEPFCEHGIPLAFHRSARDGCINPLRAQPGTNFRWTPRLVLCPRSHECIGKPLFIQVSLPLKLRHHFLDGPLIKPLSA